MSIWRMCGDILTSESAMMVGKGGFTIWISGPKDGFE